MLNRSFEWTKWSTLTVLFLVIAFIVMALRVTAVGRQSQEAAAHNADQIEALVNLDEAISAVELAMLKVLEADSDRINGSEWSRNLDRFEAAFRAADKTIGRTDDLRETLAAVKAAVSQARLRWDFVQNPGAESPETIRAEREALRHCGVAASRTRSAMNLVQTNQQHLAAALRRNWNALYLLIISACGLAVLLGALSLRHFSLRRRHARIERRSRRHFRQRRRVEEDLRRSENRYRRLIEGVGVIAWEFDRPSHRFTFVSPQAEMILGYPLHEWYHPGFWFHHVHPDDREEAARFSHEHCDRRENHEFEYRMIAADGRSVWIRDIVTVGSEKGRGDRLFGLMIDITTERTTIESLREHERMLATLMSNLPGMAYRRRNDQHWTMEFVSDGCLELTGYPPAAFVTEERTLAGALIHPEDRGAVWEGVQSALREGEPWQLVYRIIHADGSNRWVWEQGSAVGDDEGRVVAQEGFIADITEQKRVEDALRRSRAELARAQEIAQIGAWNWDIARDRMEYSAGMLAILGAAADLVPASLEPFLRAFVHHDDRPRLRDALRDAARTGAIRPVDFRIVRPDGKIRTLWADGEVQLDPSHNPVRIFGTAQDITARKEHEEELRRQGEIERLLLRELDHRVRNNLSSLITLVNLTRETAGDIDAFAEIMSGRIQAMATAHSYLSRARYGGARIRELIELLLPGGDQERIRIEGEDNLRIAPKQTTSLAIIIHELATNSLKYGALASATGRVRVSCTLEPGQSNGQVINLRWAESGARLVELKPKRGVGTSLIEGLVKSDLRGELQLRYSPQGADHLIRFAVETEGAMVGPPGE